MTKSHALMQIKLGNFRNYNRNILKSHFGEIFYFKQKRLELICKIMKPLNTNWNIKNLLSIGEHNREEEKEDVFLVVTVLIFHPMKGQKSVSRSLTQAFYIICMSLFSWV